jgi:hypothetical protein
MALPKELTTVTPISKRLALFMFFMMPIVGFFVGIRYKERMDLLDKQLVEQSLPIQRAPTPSPIPPTDTSNWKTYVNSSYKYSIQFPDTYYASTQSEKSKVQLGIDSNVCITEKYSEICDVDINIVSTKGSSLEEWIKGNKIPLLTKEGKVVNPTNTIFNNYPAMVIQNDTNVAYYIQHGNYIYYLSSGLKNERSQILSTFKFTDQNANETFCGGIASKQCPTGYTCKLDGKYPDAGGTCVKQ